jgi:periplasmic protein TonB
MRVGLFICFSVWASATTAQTAPEYPRKEVEYFTADDRKLPSVEGADHRIERTYRDSVSGTERRYNAAGKLMRITPYARFYPAVKYGAELYFYEDGQVSYKTDYRGNKRNGEFVVYYQNGQVRRHETYRDDERQTGECFAEDGSPVPFYEYEVMPTYKGGGLKVIIQSIADNVRYPRMALSSRIQGKVFVSFVVSEQGEVENIKVVKGVNGLDGAALAAVRKLGRFTPGMKNGKPVPVTVTTPITFIIN